MGKKDLTKKSLEELNDVFADIVNVLLFNGRRLVREEDLEDANPVSSYNAHGKIRNQVRDVAKFWKNHEVRIALVGLENQTEEDEDMPLRMIGYDGAAYRDQLRRGERKKEKKRYPVVSLVLYFGSTHRWRTPKTLRECFKLDQALKPYVSDYRINLFEIAYLTEKQVRMFRSDFRIVADYFVQLRKNKRYKPSEETIRHVTELLDLMQALTKNNKFEEAQVLAKRKGDNTMRTFLDEAWEQGEQKGEQKGIQKGIIKGENNKGLRIYINMRKDGISKKKATELAELTPKLVREAEAMLKAAEGVV
ncbi:MAG: Rpn family recombination-promoting nuclease/putative transposase [Lachnospiraceae bacterium]|nr:Rpn family recombination-promoting nuclease/putative transposase [Lachnospiraceae bacterium]